MVSMKTQLAIVGILSLGAGFILRDATIAPDYIEVPVVERIVTHEEFLIPYPEAQPVLVPVLIPMLTKPNEKAVPSIDWDLELIAGVKYFEGYKPNSYRCSGGVRTIGYGCTDKQVVAMGAITEKRASEVLEQDLEEAKQQVEEVVSVDLSLNQLYALTSFTFNCGVNNLKQLVEGKNRLNDGNYDSVERLLPQYRKAGGRVREGLERRRQWEVSMWKGNPEI